VEKTASRLARDAVFVHFAPGLVVAVSIAVCQDL